ncbi:hypothetical protein [Kitasatospora sp. NPDC004531]
MRWLRSMAEHVGCVRDRWPLRGLAARPPAQDVRLSGEVPDGFLIGTSAAGLLLVRDGRAERLLDGSWYYGLTRDADTWYAFERTGRHGRIVRFGLDHPGVRTALWGLDFGVHQIDVVAGDLLVTDTHHNRLLAYPTTGLRTPRLWCRTAARALPAGPLRDGRASLNYAHFNSVFGTGDSLHLVAHNDGRRTGRDSELYTVDREFTVRSIRRLGGTSCHNYCRYRSGGTEEEVYLRSDAGEVVVNGTVAHRSRHFLRGLAVGHDVRLVGASERRGPNRHTDGDPGNGGVLVFDRSWKRIGSVSVPRSQIFELRLTDECDSGLSAPARTEAVQGA